MPTLLTNGIGHRQTLSKLWTVIPTKGIHLDILADNIDGVLSSRSVKQKPEIMRDSRIGAFAAITIFRAHQSKFAFLHFLPSKIESIALVIMATLGHSSLATMTFFGKSAGQQGLGHIFVKNTVADSSSLPLSLF